MCNGQLHAGHPCVTSALSQQSWCVQFNDYLVGFAASVCKTPGSEQEAVAKHQTEEQHTQHRLNVSNLPCFCSWAPMVV